MARQAEIKRKTKETDIRVALNLDGEGKSAINTGIPFLDHMLDLFSRHGLFDLEVTCKGDLHIDDHHSVEDIAISLGQAFAEALGDKKGIARYGAAYVPMDETLARTSPGVQLTLDLTKHLCADPDIAFADSTADGEHPMIDHVWRERIEIADVFVALSPRDPYAAAIRALVKARYRAIDLVRTLRRLREKLS